MEQVTLRFSKKDKKLNVEANGFVGCGCNVLDELEASLGVVEERVAKDEAFIHDNPAPNPLNLGE